VKRQYINPMGAVFGVGSVLLVGWKHSIGDRSDGRGLIAGLLSRRHPIKESHLCFSIVN
jgi:hypothetical protein